MNILCLCPVISDQWRGCLPDLLACFNHQTYSPENRRLLISDTETGLKFCFKDGYQVVTRMGDYPLLDHWLAELSHLGKTVFCRQYSRDEYQNGKKVATEIIFEEWVPDVVTSWLADSIYLPRYLSTLAENMVEGVEWLVTEKGQATLALKTSLVQELNGWPGLDALPLERGRQYVNLQHANRPKPFRKTFSKPLRPELSRETKRLLQIASLRPLR